MKKVLWAITVLALLIGLVTRCTLSVARQERELQEFIDETFSRPIVKTGTITPPASAGEGVTNSNWHGICPKDDNRRLGNFLALIGGNDRGWREALAAPGSVAFVNYALGDKVLWSNRPIHLRPNERIFVSRDGMVVRARCCNELRPVRPTDAPGLPIEPSDVTEDYYVTAEQPPAAPVPPVVTANVPVTPAPPTVAAGLPPGLTPLFDVPVPVPVTPTPEAGTFILVATGLGGLAAWRYYHDLRSNRP